MRTFAILWLAVSSATWAASWPSNTVSLFAGEGATCELKIMPGAGAKAVWEGRILAKDSRVRVVNRRATGVIPPGPEELLWTGKGVIKFMGGRPSEFTPGARLTLAEAYLLVDLLAPIWTPAAPTGKKVPVQSSVGSGYLSLLSDGRPESLVVRSLARPLWDGSTSARVAFSHKGESCPWQTAALAGTSATPLVVFERSRFRRDDLSDDLFTVEEEGGLTLADLSKPLGNLVGSDDGGYAETAGSSAAFKSSKVVSTGGSGSVYLGPVPTADEVDRFLKEGHLGRYADEE